MIRKATEEDIKTLSYKLRNKHIDYYTIDHMKKDIANRSMFVLENNNRIIASVSLVETEFPWLGMKRLCIFNKKDNGKGYAKEIIKYVLDSTDKQICITPWVDNKPMRHIIENLGFKFKYIFNEKWCCYLK